MGRLRSTLPVVVLAALAASGVAAQEPGAVQRLLALPGGDLIGVSNASGTVRLKRWDVSGTELWSVEHPATAGLGAELLSTGEVIVPGATSSRSFSAADGGALGGPDTGGGHVVEIGPDSLLFCGPGQLKLASSDGTVLWERALVLPAIPTEGVITARAVRTGDDIMVYSGRMDGMSASFLGIGRYRLDGTFGDTVMIHADEGSMTGVHAMVRTADGGALGVATMGQGTTRLVRLDAEGDTLWTRHFGVDGTAPGYPAFFQGERVVELPDGRSILGGIAEDPRRLALLVLDAQGLPLCLETIAEAVHPPAFDIALDGLGRVNVYYSLMEEGVPLSEALTARQIDGLCLVTATADVAGASACMRVTSQAGGWLLDRSACSGPARYTLFDATGRQLSAGVVGTIQHLPAEGSAGIRILRISEGTTGQFTTLKLAAY